jgi:NAD(P) transhydrogenase subunit alpha
MLVAATTESTLGLVVLFAAAVFAAMNVVGGYVVTDRMLQMFKRRDTPAEAKAKADAAVPKEA